MIEIKDPEKTARFRKYANEKSTKLNLILGVVLVISILIYYSFIKPNSNPYIFDKIKNDTKELNSNLNRFQNQLDTLKIP